LLPVDAVDTEQTEVDALHAVGTTRIINDGVPAWLDGLRWLLDLIELRGLRTLRLGIPAAIFRTVHCRRGNWRIQVAAELLGVGGSADPLQQVVRGCGVLSNNPPDFFKIRLRSGMNAEIHAIDFAVGHVERANPFRCL